MISLVFGFGTLINIQSAKHSDVTVVNAARVSFAKEVNEIQYLADHHHVSPFFHPQARVRIKMPLFVAREWYRHQIGFARNEVSRRYVDSLRERDPK